ncbi:MAG TPA: D-arabinono-1,4-lactone oxidase [Chitinophagales bacterium]|nr:D-arabinono-1,4-lactone oxidase [Chitinophagales bacterium]
MAKKTWKNWSGIVSYQPQKVYMPYSEEEIVEVVKHNAARKRKMRTIGSGHSWTPLCETEQALISLDNYQGIESVNHAAMQATVYAGTKIHQLTQMLFQEGLALENLGDIDRQSIAGAISTGTHGTGINFGIIPTQIIGLKLVTASGDVVTCSAQENPDVFKAAQVSLGVLGIISTITFQCVPAYKLRYVADKENLHSCLANIDNYNAHNRNFEFYWFPYSDVCQTKFSNITDEPVQDNPVSDYLNGVVLENGIFGAVSEAVRLAPNLTTKVAKLASTLVSPFSKTNWSHKVYATPRMVKFNEMEYNLPIEQFKDTLLEVVDAFNHYRFKVHFPLENRFLKGDDIYLSPAYGRDSAHISFHVYKGMPYKAYFDAMESICRNHQGRPHWGKLHNLTAKELQPIFPKWNDFLKVRRSLDPNGLFLNGYLRQLFGLESPLA